ncbi:MAG: response regulator transcription factor [Bacteroidetes bacterium]|nr:response regulator transcription factor [Bacteroidota bacterium]
MSKKLIRVVIAHRFAGLRELVKELVLIEDAGLKSVGEADDFFDVFKVLETTLPDVLLIEVKLRYDESTMDNIDLIREKFPDLKIIIFTYNFRVDLMLEFIDKADAYISTSVEADELIRVIRIVEEGGTYFTFPERYGQSPDEYIMDLFLSSLRYKL